MLCQPLPSIRFGTQGNQIYQEVHITNYVLTCNAQEQTLVKDPKYGNRSIHIELIHRLHKTKTASQILQVILINYNFLHY